MQRSFVNQIKINILVSTIVGFTALAEPIPTADCPALMSEFYSALNAPAIQNTKLRQHEAALGTGSLIGLQASMSNEQTAIHNSNTMDALAEPPLVLADNIVVKIGQKDANLLVKAYNGNRTVGPSRSSKYDPKGCIGFCFGRAVVTHTEALRRNVFPESIKKIWAVGAHGKGRWEFHVTTIIRSKEERGGGWWAEDPNTFDATPLTDWMNGMRRRSDDQRMTFFVTDAFRFSVHSSQRYNALDFFGVPNSDYYNGFFKDYLESAAKEGVVAPFKE